MKREKVNKMLKAIGSHFEVAEDGKSLRRIFSNGESLVIQSKSFQDECEMEAFVKNVFAKNMEKAVH